MATPWLRGTRGHISEACGQTSVYAVAFVGDAALPPGIQNSAAYSKWVPLFQAGLCQQGMHTVSTCPDVALNADRIHWSFQSEAQIGAEVAAIIARAIEIAQYRPFETTLHVSGIGKAIQTGSLSVLHCVQQKRVRQASMQQSARDKERWNDHKL